MTSHRMRRCVQLVVVGVSSMAFLACSDGDAPIGSTTGSSRTDAAAATDVVALPTTSPADSPPPTSSASTVPGALVVSGAATRCARVGVDTVGSVASAALDEASGLIASRVHRDVLWAHNDGASGDIFALALDGTVLGVHELRLDRLGGADDIEDIAMVRGPDGDDLLLADIGDNDADRDTIRIFRVAEPAPASPTVLPDVEVLTFTYPDRAHDAEAMLVDEAAGTIVVVTKEQALDADGDADQTGATQPALVFEGPLAGHDGEPVELTLIGTLDTLALEERTESVLPHPASILGFGGVVTGGDVSPDGALVALRTYAAVWLWPRQPGESVAAAVSRVDDVVPCEVASAVERQGEAVTFVGERLATISEGDQPAIHLLAG